MSRQVLSSPEENTHEQAGLDNVVSRVVCARPAPNLCIHSIGDVFAPLQAFVFLRLERHSYASPLPGTQVDLTILCSLLLQGLWAGGAAAVGELDCSHATGLLSPLTL